LLAAVPYSKSHILNNGLDGFNAWIILNKETFELIGSLGFTGRPDNNGNIEIGFGVIPGKRNKGYCYESTVCLIDWAFKNSRVNSILAKCDSGNIQSKSIFNKLGFNMIGNEENIIIWKLQK
jgi:RimJ/RimL family protein N-acetyltransferase